MDVPKHSEASEGRHGAGRRLLWDGLKWFLGPPVIQVPRLFRLPRWSIFATGPGRASSHPSISGMTVGKPAYDSAMENLLDAMVWYGPARSAGVRAAKMRCCQQVSLWAPVFGLWAIARCGKWIADCARPGYFFGRD